MIAPLILSSAVAAADTADPDLAAAGAGDAAPRWPRDVIDRPLTLPAGLVLAGPDVLGVRDGGATHLVGDVGVGIGITDAIEVNTLTPTGTFGLIGSDLAGPWDAGIGVEILRGALGGKLEVIVRAVTGYDFAAAAARPLRVGIQAQYNVTPRFALLVHDTGVMPGISADVFGDHAVSLGLPVGAGVQLAPTVWLEADTNLVSSFALHRGTTMTAADGLPVLATGVVNLAGGALDLLFYTGCNDSYRARDTAFAGIGARWYAGSLR